MANQSEFRGGEGEETGRPDAAALADRERGADAIGNGATRRPISTRWAS